MIEASILALFIAFLFAHAFWVKRTSARNESLLARARDTLANALNATNSVEATRKGLEALRVLPGHLQVRLLIGLARSLSGAQKLTVTDLALRAGVVARAERRLESRLWWRRLHAARLLTVLGAGEHSMPRLMTDPRPAVRAQAGEWAADHPSAELIRSLLALLTDPAKLCRFTAENSLLRMGGLAVPALVGYLSSHAGLDVEAAMMVAVGLAEPRFVSPALRLCRDPVPGTRALAAELLGQLGGAEVVAVLTELLSDSDSRVRAAAARALGKLNHWPAAPALARALRDRAWDVRREAGLALRALGSPGILLLRSFLSDEDGFASDMARQVLDIPGSAAVRST
jgi:HEAT repeat protein